MFWFIPIEPLEERYTAQMFRWVIEELERRGISHDVITGDPLTQGTEAGQFLNWSSTSYYKSSQLKQIAAKFHYGLVRDGDIFFVGDIWFPGIEMIAYLRDALNIKCKIYGVNYAGPFDRTDLTRPMLYWGGYQEAAWYAMCDKVFVGSEYHKQLILDGMRTWVESFWGLEKKLIVTGLAWNNEEIANSPDTMTHVDDYPHVPLVVWPHRLSPEKNVQGLYNIAEALKGENVRFLITSSRKGQAFEPAHPGVEFKSVSKADYYSILRHADLMLSTSFHENYGYTVREATALGTPVLCPRRADYPEMILSQQNLYASDGEAIEKTLQAIHHTLPVATLRPMGGFPQMLDIMTGGQTCTVSANNSSSRPATN